MEITTTFSYVKSKSEVFLPLTPRYGGSPVHSFSGYIPQGKPFLGEAC